MAAVPHPTNLVITTSYTLLKATNVLLQNLFPDEVNFSDRVPSDSRYYFSGADCFYDAKVNALLSFVTEAYKTGRESYDEERWKNFCATLSNEEYKKYFAGSKCTDILFITDKAATWDSTNKEYDFSDTQVLGTVVFGYLRRPNEQYKMSYWLTVDEGVHWYDLQDSTATPIEGVIELS